MVAHSKRRVYDHEVDVDGDDLDIKVLTITPAIARAWLAKNLNNRPIREARVEQYARDIAAGRWSVNGEPIRWIEEDWLADGQHRLLACVRADTPFTSIVIWGLSPTVHATIDVGASRTLADELRWRDYPNAPALAAALRIIWQYEQEDGLRGIRSASPSRAELLAVLDGRPWAVDSLGIAQSTARAIRAPLSVLAGLHCLFAEHTSTDEANGFYEEVADDTRGSEGEPAYALRRYATRVAMNKTERPRQEEWAALVIKAFNAWIGGHELRHLRWRRGGRSPEPFPTITGTAYIGDDDRGEG